MYPKSDFWVIGHFSMAHFRNPGSKPGVSAIPDPSLLNIIQVVFIEKIYYVSAFGQNCPNRLVLLQYKTFLCSLCFQALHASCSKIEKILYYSQICRLDQARLMTGTYLFFSMQTDQLQKIFEIFPKIWIVGRKIHKLYSMYILSEEKFPVAITQPQHGIAPYYAIITYFPSIIIKENFSTKIICEIKILIVLPSLCFFLLFNIIQTKYSLF